jgi:hypothetical protein
MPKTSAVARLETLPSNCRGPSSRHASAYVPGLQEGPPAAGLVDRRTRQFTPTGLFAPVLTARRTAMVRNLSSKSSDFGPAFEDADDPDEFALRSPSGRRGREPVEWCENRSEALCSQLPVAMPLRTRSLIRKIYIASLRLFRSPTLRLCLV